MKIKFESHRGQVFFAKSGKNILGSIWAEMKNFRVQGWYYQINKGSGGPFKSKYEAKAAVKKLYEKE